jgi:hypothetical protein
MVLTAMIAGSAKLKAWELMSAAEDGKLTDKEIDKMAEHQGPYAKIAPMVHEALSIYQDEGNEEALYAVRVLHLNSFGAPIITSTDPRDEGLDYVNFLETGNTYREFYGRLSEALVDEP